jgi:hypothetical protein
MDGILFHHVSLSITNIYFQTYFRKLQEDGFYQFELLADRIVFWFIFVPILRRELKAYSETHNEHSIRPQLARPNHKPGIPNALYFDNHKRWGFLPDEELLSDLEEAVSDVGKYPNREMIDIQ